MSLCHKCGQKVSFRYIDGKCIPIHMSGNCIDSENFSSPFFSYYKRSDSTCFSTQCPRCNDSVYFIRHNGGAVWLDSPLGPPWYKHICFDLVGSNKDKDSLYEEKRKNIVTDVSSNEAVCVICSTKILKNRDFTYAILEAGESKGMRVKIKNNADYLLGKICILSIDKKFIWPIDEPQLIFLILEVSDIDFGYVFCSICGEMVKRKNLDKHLIKCGNKIKSFK